MLRWQPRLMALQSRLGWERVSDQHQVLARMLAYDRTRIMNIIELSARGDDKSLIVAARYATRTGGRFFRFPSVAHNDSARGHGPSLRCKGTRPLSESMT
jgi:hypothetical protein